MPTEDTDDCTAFGYSRRLPENPMLYDDMESVHDSSPSTLDSGCSQETDSGTGANTRGGTGGGQPSRGSPQDTGASYSRAQQVEKMGSTQHVGRIEVIVNEGSDTKQHADAVKKLASCSGDNMIIGNKMEPMTELEHSDTHLQALRPVKTAVVQSLAGETVRVGTIAGSDAGYRRHVGGEVGCDTSAGECGGEVGGDTSAGECDTGGWDQEEAHMLGEGNYYQHPDLCSNFSEVAETLSTCSDLSVSDAGSSGKVTMANYGPSELLLEPCSHSSADVNEINSVQFESSTDSIAGYRSTNFDVRLTEVGSASSGSSSKTSGVSAGSVESYFQARVSDSGVSSEGRRAPQTDPHPSHMKHLTVTGKPETRPPHASHTAIRQPVRQGSEKLEQTHL